MRASQVKGEPVAPLAGFKKFESPSITYTPFAPGGVVDGSVKAGCACLSTCVSVPWVDWPSSMLTQLHIRTWRCAGEGVKAGFASNFAKGLEKGAQLVIRVDGEVVVDMCARVPCFQPLCHS